MLVVRLEEAAASGQQAAVDQELPLVGVEPLRPPDVDEESPGAGEAQQVDGEREGGRRAAGPRRLAQIVPSSTALVIQGITSSSISSRVVVASKPRTSRALSTFGTRIWTSCS